MSYDGNMNEAHSNRRSDPGYRHAKHDDMARLIGEDLTDLAIARRLHVDRRAVARVRKILGAPVKTNSTSMYDKLDRFSSEPDAAGHVTWSGRTGASGTPTIRHLGKERPAAAIAFERRTGREPVGTCRADCDVPHCVADAHVMDDLERRNVRQQLRALEGLAPTPWDACPEGHDWDTHGRLEPDLTPYCKGCNTLRAQRSRDARRAALEDDR